MTVADIKKFAEENFCKDEKDQIYANDPEFAVTNPWMDHSGRFELTDEEAVREWGLDVVLEFCEKAKERRRNNNLLAAIIEKFEDFLEEKGIDIPNPDKEDDPDAAIIYGMDFGDLMYGLRDTLAAFGIETDDTWE